MTGRRVNRVALLLILLCGALTAQRVDSLFAQAGDAYRAGKYASAIADYNAILSLGTVSPGVYYNLGNAHFRKGDISRSILAYERALRLSPTDDDIRHNLRLVNLHTQDRIEPLPELFIVTWVRWLNATLPVSLSATLFLSGWALLFVSLILMYLIRSSTVIRLSRLTFFGGSGLAVLFGLLLLLQTLAVPEPHEGIILTPTVTTKSSPDAQGMDAFVIHEGLKVSLGDSVEGWVRITLPDGKTGWVRGDQVEAI